MLPKVIYEIDHYGESHIEICGQFLHLIINYGDQFPSPVHIKHHLNDPDDVEIPYKKPMVSSLGAVFLYGWRMGLVVAKKGELR